MTAATRNRPRGLRLAHNCTAARLADACRALALAAAELRLFCVHSDAPDDAVEAKRLARLIRLACAAIPTPRLMLRRGPVLFGVPLVRHVAEGPDPLACARGLLRAGYWHWRGE